MGITIPYFFGLRMGVGMGMVFIYNQLLISDLGSGSNARVQRALYNNQEVAVKIFNKHNDKKSEVEYLKEVIIKNYFIYRNATYLVSRIKSCL
jgi:hypothetical protein